MVREVKFNRWIREEYLRAEILSKVFGNAVLEIHLNSGLHRGMPQTNMRATNTEKSHTGKHKYLQSYTILK